MPNYSMKPGRGPSAMGVVGGIIAVLFGIFWMVGAFSVTSHFPADDSFAHIFPFFGLIFIAAAIAGIVYNLHNASGRNRFSTFDVVESGTEPDPLDPHRPLRTFLAGSIASLSRRLLPALRRGVACRRSFLWTMRQGRCRLRDRHSHGCQTLPQLL